MIPHDWDSTTSCCRVCGSETQNNNCRDDVIGITWLRRNAINSANAERASLMAVHFALRGPPQGEGA